MAEQDVGRISVAIVGDESPLLKQISNLGARIRRPIEKQADSINNALQKPLGRLKSTITAAFSTAVIAKFVKDSTQAAAQVNAANSQMTQTFGKFEDRAHSAMQKVAKDSGILETRLQGVGTSIYAFAKASGMDSASALSMMQDALQVTADSAAYYDRSLEDTAESLKSFLKGNYANDAALGISCTETTRNTVANRLYGKSFKDLSEAQKQLALLQTVKDANRLSGAMGQAAREADGWENVTGNFKESWRQLLSVIGQPVLKVATIYIKKLTAGIQQLTVYAQSAVQKIGALFGWDLSQNSGAPAGIEQLSDSASDSEKNLGGAAKAAEKLKKAVAGFDQMNILSDDNSSDGSSDSGSSASSGNTAVSDAVSVLDAAEKTISGKFSSVAKSFSDAFTGAWNKSGAKVLSSCKKMLAGILSLITTIGNNFKSAWDKGKNGEAILTNILDTIANITEGIGNIAEGLSEAFDTPAGRKAAEKLLGIIRRITDHAVKMTDMFREWSDDVDFKPLVESFNNLLDPISDIVDNCLSGMEDFVKDVVEPLATWTIEEALPGLLNLIAEGLKHVSEFSDDAGEDLSEVKDKLDELFTTISPIAMWLAGAFQPIVNAVIETIWSNITSFYNSIMSYINGVIDILSGVLKFIAGVFTGDWKKAWEGIQQIFKGQLEIMLAILGPILNAITNAFKLSWTWIQSVWNAVSPYFKDIWENIKKTFAAVAEWFRSKFNDAWQKIVLIWNAAKDYFNGIWEGIKKAFLNVGNFFRERFETAWTNIKNSWSGVTTFFDGIWDGIKNTFSHVSNWFGDVFGDAWEKVKNVFSSGGQTFLDIKDSVLNSFKQTVNSLVDGINQVVTIPFNGINDALKGLRGVNIMGMKPFEWMQEISIPQIPHLAKGGLVTAPTLAMVGDNKGAAHDPEIVSPLSKLQGMLNRNDPEIISLLMRIINLLEQEESVYQNNIYIDGENIERKLTKVRKRKQRRYGGTV